MKIKNNQKHFVVFRKNLFVGLLGLVYSLTSWWAFANFMPRPLGNENTVEYLGKDSYGCWHGYCDSRLTYVYYYATDMQPSELVRYFKKASIDQEDKKRIEILESKQDIPSGAFLLKTSNGKSFYIHMEKSIQEKALKNPTKKYIFSILANDYQAAKEAL